MAKNNIFRDQYISKLKKSTAEIAMLFLYFLCKYSHSNDDMIFTIEVEILEGMIEVDSILKEGTLTLF